MTNNWNQQWESIRLVSFKNVQEVIIFEETHGAISDLKVETRDAFDKSLEDLRNVWLELLHLASFQDFNQFRNEHDLFRRVSKGPVLNESIEQEQPQRWILG